MYKGKHVAPRKRRPGKLGILALVLLLGISVSGTIAYLTSIQSLTHSFSPTTTYIDFSPVVLDSSEGNTKSSIIINNTGNASVYIRVALVSSTTDANGNLIADNNTNLADLTLGEGWIKIGNYYYFTSPIGSGSSTENLLAAPIELAENQTVTALAQCIQDSPKDAMIDAWGVDPETFQEVTGE